MPIFYYKAKDKDGHDTKGTVEAKDEKQVLAILKEKKYTPFFLREKSDDLFSSVQRKIFQRASIADIANFTRQLSTMINAGLPLTEALVILKSQGNPQISEAAGLILRDVEGGSTLSDAMEKFPKIFSTVYVALVRAGESAGVLDDILGRMADNLETQREFQAKIKGALVYPVIVVLGMTVVIFIMMIFVIPKMLDIYKEFDAKLPVTTQILISVSKFMATFWWLFLLAFFGLGYLYRSTNSNRNGKRRIDALKFKLPIIGKLQNQVTMAELTRTLGLLLGAGVPITEALEISAKTANNIPIEEGIMLATKQVEKGFPLSAALGENQFFPPIIAQMLSVGEETGKLDEVLLKVSRFFQSESEESIKGLTTAIEPLIMIVLGVGVGFLIVAVIMPIYSLSSSIK